MIDSEKYFINPTSDKQSGKSNVNEWAGLFAFAEQTLSLAWNLLWCLWERMKWKMNLLLLKSSWLTHCNSLKKKEWIFKRLLQIRETSLILFYRCEAVAGAPLFPSGCHMTTVWGDCPLCWTLPGPAGSEPPRRAMNSCCSSFSHTAETSKSAVFLSLWMNAAYIETLVQLYVSLLMQWNN